LSICLYFINYCIAYNVASFDTNSGPDAGAHLLFGVELRVEFLDVLNLPLLLKETLTFGFDYLSLVLCTMSALVFSFVFLSNLHNESIRDKRAFFGLLLLVELFVLGAFLCTNLLGFFVFFESSLLPMAVLIGVWGSSEKK
jgi:NADH-quinone oxidoreductase subunit M